MPYKRRSGFSRHFASPNFWLFGRKLDFFNTHRLWVLKKSLNGMPFHLRACVAGFLIFVRLSCGGQNRCCRPTEEAHQSLDVLSYRCQEELLAHEPESPQTQAPQSDLILQFREQGFHLLSLPLCFGELWRVDQLPRTLSGWFVLADHAGGNCEDAWSA
jgi:hypothetical protein